MTQEHYTGVHGAVTYGVAALAVAEFGFDITRAVTSHARSGKWSDLNVPGKLSCKGKLKRIQLNADLIQAMLNATPVTGETAAAHAGLAGPGDGEENITDMTDTAPTSASLVRLTCLTAAVTVAGVAVLIGTDAAGNAVAESVAIPTMAADAYVTSKGVYATLTQVALTDVTCAGGTIGVGYRAGDSTVTVGEPKSFALIGKVTDGTNHITVTLANVFFTKAGLNFTDASKMLEDDMDFIVKDPDVDIIVTGADT